MTNYTPSTGFMRDIYANYVAKYSNDSQEELFEEFDRWLLRVQAEALQEARDAVRAASFWADGSDNYADRVRGYLSARAERLAAGAVRWV